MKFPQPWQMQRTGPDEFIVLDANDRKLFYIIGDEGDGEEIEPSVLFYGDEADTETLLDELVELFTKPSAQ